MVDEAGFKRIGSAQFRKKGVFLQHGEIQLNPSRDLWEKLFNEEAPPPIILNLPYQEIIKYLKDSFIKEKKNLKIKNLNYTDSEIKNILII